MALRRIEVHPSNRYLITETGQPFFLLSDTAWELFHRLTRDEAYFEDVDWIVDRAEELGLYVGMLPTWGDKWYDPRTGEFLPAATMEISPWKTTLFIPPGVNDWVLILESI